MRWWTSIYGAHFVAYSFRELGVSLLPSKLRWELNSFLRFPPPLRSSSSPLNWRLERNKRHVKSRSTWRARDHRAFYRFRKLLSSKWKPCHVFENKGWKDIYIFQDCWRRSVKDFILACGVQLHTPKIYSILNCSIFLRFGKWRR